MRRPEILIAEDNFLTATELSDIVRDCGFAVAGTVAHVNRGLDLLAERPVDGAIVDINLDGTFAFPLCAELGRRKVPFCFLTGYSADIIPSDFRSTPLLSKPVDRQQMRAALTTLLRERPAPACHPQPGRGNRLLQSLDEAGWAAIEPVLERSALVPGEVLQEPGDRPAHVIFPITGAVSIEAGNGHRHLQVAMVGREGLVGTSLLLDGIPANRAVVQFGGATWRVPTAAFVACLERSGDLHRQLLRGASAFIAELSRTALANGLGTIEQRLARWLLIAAERLDDDLICVTHDRLGQILGVRRAGVTVALHMLEGRQALRSERRRVRLLDRERLAEAAGPFRPL